MDNHTIAHEIAHSWFRGNDIHEVIVDEIDLQIGGRDMDTPWPTVWVPSAPVKGGQKRSPAGG